MYKLERINELPEGVKAELISFLDFCEESKPKFFVEGENHNCFLKKKGVAMLIAGLSSTLSDILDNKNIKDECKECLTDNFINLISDLETILVGMVLDKGELLSLA